MITPSLRKNIYIFPVPFFSEKGVIPQIESESEDINLSISEDDLDEDCKKYYRKYKKNMLKLREEKKDKKNRIKEKLLDEPIKNNKSEDLLFFIA